MVDSAPRVLVVDDERFFRESIREALEAAGIGCVTAEDAASALALAAETPLAVAVVDLGLPDAGGLEVLKQLAGGEPATRVIVLSAHSEQDRVLDALRLDAADYLAKPLHDEELVMAVRRALRGHAVESRFAALRERVCELDARAAALADRAGGAPDGERLPVLAPAVAEAVAAVLGAARTSLMVTGRDGSLSVAAAVGSRVPLEELDVVMPGESIAGIALSDGEPLVVEDLAEDERLAGRTKDGRYATRSLVVTPVVGDRGPLGVLCATDRVDGSPFAVEDLALLRLLAAQVGQLLAPDFAGAAPAAGTAADAALLLTEAVASDPPGTVAEAELARMVCDALTTEVEPDRLISVCLGAVSQTLGAAPVALFLIDNRSGRLCLEGQIDGAGVADHSAFDRMQGLTGLVLQTGQPVAADHPDRDPRFDAAVDTPTDGAVRPFLCAPVKMRGKTMGLVRAFLKDGASASPAAAEVVSAVISAAVRNVLLYRSLLDSIDEVARVRRGRREQGGPGVAGAQGVQRRGR